MTRGVSVYDEDIALQQQQEAESPATPSFVPK